MSVIIFINDDLSVRDVKFKQYDSSIDTIPNYVANDALKKLGYDPVPTVSPSTSPYLEATETLRIPQNEIVIFSKDEVPEPMKDSHGTIFFQVEKKMGR